MMMKNNNQEGKIGALHDQIMIRVQPETGYQTRREYHTM